MQLPHQTINAVLLNQWAVAHWWSTKFVQEGHETFEDVIIFWYLAKMFLENYLIFWLDGKPCDINSNAQSSNFP